MDWNSAVSITPKGGKESMHRAFQGCRRELFSADKFHHGKACSVQLLPGFLLTVVSVRDMEETRPLRAVAHSPSHLPMAPGGWPGTWWVDAGPESGFLSLPPTLNNKSSPLPSPPPMSQALPLPWAQEAPAGPTCSDLEPTPCSPIPTPMSLLPSASPSPSGQGTRGLSRRRVLEANLPGHCWATHSRWSHAFYLVGVGEKHLFPWNQKGEVLLSQGFDL